MTQESYEEIQAAHEAQATISSFSEDDHSEDQWYHLPKCEIKGCRKPFVKLLNDSALGIGAGLCWEHFHKAYTALERFRMARIRLMKKQRALFISNLGA